MSTYTENTTTELAEDYLLGDCTDERIDTLTYKAWQKPLNREVELIALRPEFASQTNYVENFLNDARAQAQFTHPIIASVYEAHVSEESIFYTRELPKGTSLLHLTQSQKKLHPLLILTLLEELAQACLFLEENATAYAAPLAQQSYLSDDFHLCFLNTAHASTRDPHPNAEHFHPLFHALKKLTASDDPKSPEVLDYLDILLNENPFNPPPWTQILQKIPTLRKKLQASSPLRKDTKTQLSNTEKKAPKAKKTLPPWLQKYLHRRSIEKLIKFLITAGVLYFLIKIFLNNLTSS